LSGGGQLIQVVLKNSQDHQLDLTIRVQDHQLAQDWHLALYRIVRAGLPLDKHYCFLGLPLGSRDLVFLCDLLNDHIHQINASPLDYRIEEYFCPDALLYSLTQYQFEQPQHIKQGILNRLHQHFEVLQGTVESPSAWAAAASAQVQNSIAHLNLLCHELENRLLADIKWARDPYWMRPSQIVQFAGAPRLPLKPSHREGFALNGYDRVFGGVYMHWCQIGKTYYEVFRDEGAPVLTDAVCTAITDLRYYSGEFDIEWGRDIVRGGANQWHDQEMDQYYQWLTDNGLNTSDPQLSLGYLPLAQVDLISSFGTGEPEAIWHLLSEYSNIIQIECQGATARYDY
jgi:hypothetical protein